MDNNGNIPLAQGQAGHAPHGSLSKTLHWVTAALVLAIFTLGMWPGLMKGSAALHRSLGLALLFVVLMRLSWRFIAGSAGPRPGSRGGVSALAAKVMHRTLYAALLTVPVLGWMHLNLKGVGVSAFGVALPALTGVDRELASLVLRAKWWLAYGMLGAIGLHAAAALAHHYVLRDDVLASMMPDKKRASPIAPGAGTMLPPIMRIVAGMLSRREYQRPG